MAEFLRDSQRNGASSTNGGGEAEEPIQGHLVTSSTNNRLYSETLKEFSDWFFSAPQEDYDGELLDAYLEEMDMLSPQDCSFDSQASLKKFHERFSTLFDGQKEPSVSEVPKHQVIRLPRELRKLGVVAAIIIGIFGMLVTAQAVGIDVLGAIGRWTEETFHFESLPVGSEQEPAALSYSECCELLYAALEECGIEEDLVPKWCPDRFQASEPKISKTGTKDVISVTFQDAEEHPLFLVITHYKAAEHLGKFIFEKDNSSVEQYTNGSMSFYVLSNNDTITATWSDGLLVEKISGNLTTKETRTIIDSIGGNG